MNKGIKTHKHVFCSQGNGAKWCNGDCFWSDMFEECQVKQFFAVQNSFIGDLVSA